MSIHVLQLGPYPPPQGGITRNVLAIRERLLERGDRCSIIATSRSTTRSDDGDVFHPRSATELISLIRKTDHDVLHLHVGGDISRRVLSLLLAAATFGKRPVLTVHSGGYSKTPEAQKAKPNSARGRIFRQFSRIIGVNDELADVFRRYGVPDERIAVIAPFSLKPPDGDVALPVQIAGFAATHSPLLVSVGGLEPDYEPLFLIDAMNGVIERHPKAGLMMIGGGSMAGEVERAAAGSGYSNSICLAGDVPHAQTLNLIAQADALLRITLFDGDAISVREALFVGTPVIATDNGMRPDGVRLSPRVDEGRLMQNIDEALSKRVPRPQHLTADYSNIDKVLALYDELF
ncbi:MAG: glycosyltransferase family 4 protein [Acidobacteria bacterium]|nr:glycosyltransferase family 4 protein [Acidobacteriota bacterium]